MLKADGFNDCVLGLCERIGQPDIIAYDVELILDKLKNEDGMTDEEAEEYFQYNILGAYIGEETPCFITRASFAELIQYD